jgi:hypothetical protein
MSLVLWNKLPSGFLKKQFKAWDKLDPDVKRLIVKLAEEQKFKCVHCSRVRDLIIEHDHDPLFGAGDKPTVLNIRGLVCQRCNWHLMLYERDLNGEYRGFDDAHCCISDREWESYIYAYDCRVIGLYESRLEEQMGGAKYWRRRLILDQFDYWKDWTACRRNHPWHRRFGELKERRRNTIRTPEQFFKMLAAILEYTKAQLAKDPDWRPPEEAMPSLLRIKEFLDELYPIIEPQYLELLSKKEAVAQGQCSRGNQSSGTPRVLPSDNSTHIVCSSKRTLVAEMLMPSLQEKIAVVFDDAQDIRKFPWIGSRNCRLSISWVQARF